MACGSSSYTGRSVVRYYNNASQALTAGAATTLTLAGSKVVNSGAAISVQPGSYEILRTGIYHVSADVTVTGAAAGEFDLQWYMDGVPLPCTLTKATLANAYTNQLHTETDLSFKSCCGCVDHTLTLVATPEAAATVTHICTGIIKE